mgnify:CR=1 FL=1
MREFVFDATLLSNFSAADQVSVLKDRDRGVGFTTVEVSAEFRRGVKAAYEHWAPALQQTATFKPGGSLRVLTLSSADEHRLRKALDRPPGSRASSLCLSVGSLTRSPHEQAVVEGGERQWLQRESLITPSQETPSPGRPRHPREHTPFPSVESLSATP